MFNISKTLLALSVVLVSTLSANADTLVKASGEFKPSAKINFEANGKSQITTRNGLRKIDPKVYRLYVKTERAAINYKANPSRGVPLSCTFQSSYVGCQTSGWYCTVFFNDLQASNCGVAPPPPPKS